MYRAIIVDDELKACHVLKSLILELNLNINVTHVINYPLDAVQTIEEQKPDILFLDIDMPYLSGFDILQKIENPDFEIIFVTGHNEYAINAFKVSASGYILKPIDIDELSKTLLQSIERIKLKKSSTQNKVLINNLYSNTDQKIGIPTMEGLDFVSIASIIRCEAVLKCTKIFTESHPTLISSYNIGEFKKLLDNYNFFATHKSHIINLEKIKKYYKDGTILMQDDSMVPLARRRKQDFLVRIPKLN